MRNRRQGKSIVPSIVISGVMIGAILFAGLFTSDFDPLLAIGIVVSWAVVMIVSAFVVRLRQRKADRDVRSLKSQAG